MIFWIGGEALEGCMLLRDFIEIQVWMGLRCGIFCGMGERNGG